MPASVAEHRVPRVPPLEGEAGRLKRLLLQAQNPLREAPAAAYRDPIVVLTHKPAFAFVCGPDLVQEVLLDRRDEFPKDPIQKALLSPFGQGILLAEGEDWRWQRRLAAGLFRHSDVIRYVPAMVAGAETALAAWREAPPGSVRPIEHDMVRATYNVIANTLLMSDHSAAGEIEESIEVYKAGLPWAIATKMLQIPDWVPHPGKRGMRREAVSMRANVARMIEARRSMPVEREDLFTNLLGATDPETGAALSDDQLVDNLLTFLLAGHETTATALTWSLYLLSQMPEWAVRIRNEAIAAAGDGPIESGHVDKLEITLRFLKESMRLLPPVPLLSRAPRSDTTLGGVRIGAGTMLFIPIYIIHRHEALWADPDRFDPDRFAPERERSYSRYQFMPFGAGPRVCIGSAFALIEGTVMLATLVRAATFAFAGDQMPEPVANIVLAAKGGVPLRVTLRDGVGAPAERAEAVAG